MTSGILEVDHTAPAHDRDARCGTRNLVTSSGESRSELFQRLRRECVWQDAEFLKEQVRATCRDRGTLLPTHIQSRTPEPGTNSPLGRPFLH
jgi:hypothetical protein